MKNTFKKYQYLIIFCVLIGCNKEPKQDFHQADTVGTLVSLAFTPYENWIVVEIDSGKLAARPNTTSSFPLADGKCGTQVHILNQRGSLLSIDTSIVPCTKKIITTKPTRDHESTGRMLFPKVEWEGQ